MLPAFRLDELLMRKGNIYLIMQLINGCNISNSSCVNNNYNDKNSNNFYHIRIHNLKNKNTRKWAMIQEIQPWCKYNNTCMDKDMQVKTC